ncbi:hypothetical protein C9374_004178 [Naegleria lovaniensis]|uniref:F-box domain-containing protein n=1 Tax=Naegleria lovaniensis TaxID=51637 RepID=A0AA88KJR2_NAELO|nr:uncharacterized protein C9374_004178 [Naegleria lovaniensis]KAG2383507.1 hypothetical protein C9374_004178 [Naegleria lovaniensis]
MSQKKGERESRTCGLIREAKQVLCSPDVLYEIFSYLVFSDVVHRIILVNKTWKSIVANLNKLWEDYILFQWPDAKLTMDMRRTSSLETFKNYYTNNCYECFKTLKKASSFSTLRSRTGCVIKVCDDCAFSGPYSERKLYTKTRMYELLKLNDKDIANLPYKEGYSNAYRKTTTNLCLKNCYHKALSKYFTKGGIEANNERLKAIAEKRRQNLENAKKERKAELIKALEEEGLELRADSRLCEAYINGTCHQSLEQVVDTMKEMRFYHETISSYVQSEFEAMNNWFDNEDMDDRWLRREMRSVNRAEIAYPAALKSWVHDMKGKGETLETLLETAPSTLHADIEKAYSKK